MPTPPKPHNLPKRNPRDRRPNNFYIRGVGAGCRCQLVYSAPCRPTFQGLVSTDHQMPPSRNKRAGRSMKQAIKVPHRPIDPLNSRPWKRLHRASMQAIGRFLLLLLLAGRQHCVDATPYEGWAGGIAPSVAYCTFPRDLLNVHRKLPRIVPLNTMLSETSPALEPSMDENKKLLGGVPDARKIFGRAGRGLPPRSRGPPTFPIPTLTNKNIFFPWRDGSCLEPFMRSRAQRRISGPN